MGYAIIPPASPKRDKTNQPEKGQTMKEKQKSKVVVVKVEGCFTEWYAPTFKDPYEDNEEYAEFYDQKILDMQPVIGPAVDGESETLCPDLTSLAERMTCDAENWDTARNRLIKAIKEVLATGKVQTFKYEGMDDVKITPYKELPKIPEKAFKVYGKFAKLVKERVAAI